MQKDAVLLVPMCSMPEIEACPSKISTMKRLNPDFTEYKVIEGDTERPQLLCEVSVPVACPRIQCLHIEDTGDIKVNRGYRPCRMAGVVQSQPSGTGSMWIKLPCSICDETRQLHPKTEVFFHAEDAGGN